MRAAIASALVPIAVRVLDAAASWLIKRIQKWELGAGAFTRTADADPDTFQELRTGARTFWLAKGSASTWSVGDLVEFHELHTVNLDNRHKALTGRVLKRRIVYKGDAVAILDSMAAYQPSPHRELLDDVAIYGLR